MVKKVLLVTDKRLRKKSKTIKKIDKKVLSLITDLKDTLFAQKDPEGVGLAAPQIGKNIQVFVMKRGKEAVTVINPKILKIYQSSKTLPKKKRIMEGCLSLPHHYGPLRRPQKIKIKYLNEKGKKVVETFYNLEAQIIHHEIDHLKGVIFIDRLLEQNKPLYELVNNEWQMVDLL